MVMAVATCTDGPHVCMLSVDLCDVAHATRQVTHLRPQCKKWMSEDRSHNSWQSIVYRHIVCKFMPELMALLASLLALVSCITCEHRGQCKGRCREGG